MVNVVDPKLIRRIVIVSFILSLVQEMEAMVSRLVDQDVGNRASEEEIVSGSEGPNISKRVQMVTAISRPTTAQMVLGQEALYLPDDHPLLRQIQSSVAIQGRVLANSDGPALTRLELTIHMADDEANTLVSSLMSDRADSPILEGVLSPMVLPGA